MPCRCVVFRTGRSSHGVGVCGAPSRSTPPYVTLVEILGVVLLTADLAVSRVPGAHCDVEIMARAIGPGDESKDGPDPLRRSFT
ncbi:MAG: hypothetical protein ACRDVP_07780 [Acidimicrobiales bacterium]